MCARAAILTALNTLDSAAARPLLQAALKDRDWAVRVKAATLLREQGVTDTAMTMRPAPERPMDDAERRTLLAPPFSPHAFIETDKGTVEIELAILDAPLTVSNFVALARKGFFNGIAIHRVVPAFVVQDGDPRGDGEGAWLPLRDELISSRICAGTVGMALDWKDTGAASSLYPSPQPHLDARYTCSARRERDRSGGTHPAVGCHRRVQIWEGHRSLYTASTQKRDAKAPPFSDSELPLLRRLLLSAFCLLAMRSSSLQV